MNIPRCGEQELTDANALFKSTSERKYRHNSISAPNVNSKSFARKQNQREAVLRKKGFKGEQLKNMMKEMTPDPIKSFTAKSELKSAQQITKARKLKEQRRAKTGRHGHKSKSKQSHSRR